MPRMPVPFEDMAQLMIKAVRIVVTQDLDRTHAIGAARQTKGVRAGLIVDVVDEPHMNQCFVTGRRTSLFIGGASG